MSNLNSTQNACTNQNSNSNPSNFELESQIILRLPLVKGENGLKKPHPKINVLREILVKKLKKISEDSAQEDTSVVDELKERLNIELNTETRKGRLKFDDEIFEARLVDLPCIVESLKTIDKKMFYKTADICQMLVCRTKDDPWNSDEEMLKSTNKKDSKTKKDLDKNNALNKYKWPHGLAPPLKNVRRKRFRKMAKKKIVDYAEIEKEVKQIFRADRDASKIDYEVMWIEGELDDENDDEKKNSDRNNSLNNDDEYEESSQEDVGATEYGNSCMDSAMDIESNKLSNPAQRTLKSSKLIEESNMSFIDDDSMMATTLTKSKLPETDIEDGETTTLNPINFDECSMDNSNLIDQDKPSKQRIGFKNLFVQDVLGDLSSSDENDDDEDDEDENKSKNKENDKVVKSFKFNLDKNSIHMTNKPKNENTFTGDESTSNCEDSNIGYTNQSESEISNLENVKFENDENQSGVTKAKNLDILDTFEDTDNEVSLDVTSSLSLDVKKKKNEEDLNFSDLSSSSNSSGNDVKVNKTKMNVKLSNLIDELQKIKDDREKRENEIKNINNPVLRAHLSSRLNNLIDEENKKQLEIDEIKNALNE